MLLSDREPESLHKRKTNSGVSGTSLCENTQATPDVTLKCGQSHHLRLCLWLLRSLWRLWEGEGEHEDDREELDDGLLCENTLR